MKASATVREALGELHKKQIIFEAETLAAVIAYQLWAPRFSNRRCLLFVDNEGVSENSVMDFLAEKFVELEAVTHTFTWLARVPSGCNVADAPSRGDVSAALLNNALDVSADAERLLLDLVSQLSEMGKIGCAPDPTGKRKRVSAAS